MEDKERQLRRLKFHSNTELQTNLACHLIPHNASHLQRELKMLSQNQDENSKYKHKGHAILLPQNAKWRDYRCAPPGLVNCNTSL